MHPPSLKSAVRRIRSLAIPPEAQTDRDLLGRFRASRDDRAFAAIVVRHGPAVLGVCRRVLADPHAADDAFQATFLVLARRATSVREAASLGCWLHGVALRVATKLKGQRARRPRPVATMEVPADPRDDVLWRDVRRVLDEEVNRLPDRLRLPVYLCYFEGKTRDEAAEALGWKLTTLRGRLEDGRLRLRSRLALRGIELSAALLAVSAADGLAVSDPLLESTVQAVGGSAADSIQSLARGIVMSGVQGKTVLSVGAVLLALGLGSTLLVYRGEAGETPGPGPTPKTPPADEKPQLSNELLDLMQAADRVWVVDPPTDTDPIPEPIEVLKGMSPPDKGYSFRFKAEALKELPRKGRRSVVFLKSIDEVDHIPKVIPLTAERWFVPADDATLAALREFVPPCQWGESVSGLRLGLHARPNADEPTVEVVLQNVGSKDFTIEQFRGNYFDSWPGLTFSITAPSGKTYRLDRIGPPQKDGDAPRDRVLKPGERYIQVVRLDRWLKPSDRAFDSPNVPAGLFAGGGDFRVTATYELADSRDPPRWWVGKLTTKRATVSIPVPGLYGELAGEFRLRLRPSGQLRVGETPELAFDVWYSGKEKQFVIRLPENAEVELDGKWFTSRAEGSFGGRMAEFTPDSEHPAWLTIRPDRDWGHLRDKPDAAGDPGEAIKELIPFRLTAGQHTMRVAYRFGKDVKAVSNAITVAVAPDGWGEQVGGVKARLRMKPTKLAPGSPLVFDVDLKNEGRKTWNPVAFPFGCEVFVDDEKYAYYGELDFKAARRELKPGAELIPFVTVTMDSKWQTRRAPDGPREPKGDPPSDYVQFRLTAGKHRVRVDVPPDNGKPRLTSSTVEIDVEAQQLDADTRAMALGANRIWVVPSPTRDKPVPSPIEVLKGPPGDAGRGGLFDLRLLPGDDPAKKWIVFLHADEDGKPTPEVKLLRTVPWSWPFSPETADAIRWAILPAEWGQAKDSLRLGLRLRQDEATAGGPVGVEVTVQNAGPKPVTIDQHRFNIYDYWPRTQFEVTGPGGTKWILEKPAGAMDEADAPTRCTLKPGDSYTHAFRLDRWVVRRAIPKEGTYTRNVFASPGEFAVVCRYAHASAGGEVALVSNAVKVTVSEGPKATDWGDAVNNVRARLRLAKTKLKSAEPLTFDLEIRNEGDAARKIDTADFHCQISLDGKQYAYAGPIDHRLVFKDLPAKAELVPFLSVTPNEGWHRLLASPAIPFRLSAGKHTLAVAYPVDAKTRVVTRTVEFEIVLDDWGEAVGGVSARLRMPKAKFHAGENLAFELDLKSAGDKSYDVAAVPAQCVLYLDGWAYQSAEPGLGSPSSLRLAPGKELVPFLKFDMGGKWSYAPMRQPTAPGPLLLRPGKHKLRVAYPVAVQASPTSFGQSMPTTKEIEFEVANDEWGEAVGGVSARLRMAKNKFKPGENLAFELDMKCVGDKTYDVSPIPPMCELELDGALFKHADPISWPGSNVRLAPGEERAPFLKFNMGGNWAPIKEGRMGKGALLPLTPGKHRLRVSFLIADKVLLFTKTVEFEVAADDAKAPDLATLIAASDRIVVATIDWKAGQPRLKPSRTLKGPNNRWQPDVRPITVPAGADLLPGELPEQPDPDRERSVGPYILFLKAEEEGVEVPKLAPAAAHGWYRPATDKEIEVVLAAVPRVTESGTAKNGLALALRPTTTTRRVGEVLRFEVLLTNAGKSDLRVLQHRYNVYDYWPFLTFTVTGPDGKKVVVQKPEGPFTREDFIDEIALKAGEIYAHSIRLNRWPTGSPGSAAGGGGPNGAFGLPGKYTVTATYSAPLGFRNLNPRVIYDDWPFWNGTLTSNPVTVEVTPAVGVERRKAFTDGADRLGLRLYRVGEKAPPGAAGDKLHLHVTPSPNEPQGLESDNVPVGRAARITAAEAVKLIETLGSDRFFDLAYSPKKAPELRGKVILVEVWTDGSFADRLQLVYPWTEETVRRIKRLGDCLNGTRPNLVKDVIAPLADTVPPWGEAISGVATRLHVPHLSSPTILELEIGNRGTKSPLFVQHAAWVELEVDGTWFQYPSGPVDVLGSPLVPNAAPGRIQLFLEHKWVRKEQKERLEVKSGKHTIRAAYVFDSAEPKNDGGFRVASQPVELYFPGGPSPFDEVRLVAEPGQVPLMYVVRTFPKSDHRALEDLVLGDGGAALAEADLRKFTAGKIVFLVRDRAGDNFGFATGFNREQLAEIEKSTVA
jgi:RNA polymerase sigma factor (sigma-70 family)